MLDFTSLTARAEADPLASAESAEAMLRELPGDNVLEAQRRLSEALANVPEWRKASVERYRALRLLDARTRGLLEGLLSEHATLGAQAPALERDLWRAASALCASFGAAFEHLLQLARETGPDRTWAQRLPELLVRLCSQREIELALTLCRYEPWPREKWKQLHAALRFAQEARVDRQAVVVGRRADDSAITLTPEQAYLRILLLQMTGGGDFVPLEIVWARRAIARWSAPLSLQAPGDADAGPDPSRGLVVDLNGAEGLRRTGATPAGCLRLDTSPIVAAIEQDLAQLSGSASQRDAAGVTLARRLVLLRKMKTLFASGPVRIRRRGERIETNLQHVQAAIGGVHTLYRVLRDEAQRATEIANAHVPYMEEITITDTAGGAPARAPSARALPRTLPGGAALGVGALLQSWHVRDTSESGCLLRGRTLDARQLLPGKLIAFRADETAPWTVGVVRRLRKMPGNNVDLGIEFLGRNPQRIVLSAPADEEAPAKGDSCAALRLPESASSPRVPISTLILPAHEFASGRVMRVGAAENARAIRLKEPLEHQLDFVWTTFEVVGSAPGRD